VRPSGRIAAPLTVALTLAAVLLLSACGPDPNSIAAQAQSGDRKGYVSQDGSIQRLGSSTRRAPLSLAGSTLRGTPWTLAGDRGKVVVLNVWGSWCPPCVAEAPDLQKAWTRLSREPGSAGRVQFMGIDIRESRANGAAFVRSHGITYPSLSDEGSQALLSLQGAAPSPPTTIVLDPQGRIAARVLGPVSADTLTALVHDVLAESA